MFKKKKMRYSLNVNCYIHCRFSFFTKQKKKRLTKKVQDKNTWRSFVFAFIIFNFSDNCFCTKYERYTERYTFNIVCTRGFLPYFFYSFKHPPIYLPIHPNQYIHPRITALYTIITPTEKKFHELCGWIESYPFLCVEICFFFQCVPANRLAHPCDESFLLLFPPSSQIKNHLELAILIRHTIYRITREILDIFWHTWKPSKSYPMDPWHLYIKNLPCCIFIQPRKSDDKSRFSYCLLAKLRIWRAFGDVCLNLMLCGSPTADWKRVRTKGKKCKQKGWRM